MRPRALRGAGRMLRLYQRSGLEALARRLELTSLLPADLRRLEPQAPAIAAQFSDQSDCGTRGAAGRRCADASRC